MSHQFESFMAEHHDILVAAAPKGAGQRLYATGPWVVMMPIHHFANGTVLGMTVELSEKDEMTLQLDYRLIIEGPDKTVLRSIIMVMGEFGDTLGPLKHTLVDMGLDSSLADSPNAHLMLYYIEALYEDMEDRVHFKAQYARWKPGNDPDGERSVHYGR